MVDWVHYRSCSTGMQQKYLKLSIVAMRLALGIIFLWFGLLKFYSPNPVYDLLKATFSFWLILRECICWER